MEVVAVVLGANEKSEEEIAQYSTTDRVENVKLGTKDTFIPKVLYKVTRAEDTFLEA